MLDGRRSLAAGRADHLTRASLWLVIPGAVDGIDRIAHTEAGRPVPRVLAGNVHSAKRSEDEEREGARMHYQP